MKRTPPRKRVAPAPVMAPGVAKKTISIPYELHLAARRKADTEHRSLSNYITQLIRRDVLGGSAI